MQTDRRSVLKAAGIGTLMFSVGGLGALLTPAEARLRGADFRVLKPLEVACLEAFGEALVPGAAKAGIAHYIDAQLAGDPVDSLLMIRYMDIPPPWEAFYRGSAAGLDDAAERMHGKPFSGLDAAEAAALTGRVSADNVGGWEGPPPSAVYFALRADAVDVVYGTQAGFESLGIPYLAHIEPEAPW